MNPTSKTIYTQSGNTFRPVPREGLHDAMPAQTFTLKKDMTGAMFLQEIDDFKLPEIRYGQNDVLAKRIIQTFLLRKKQTGVLLSGEKGSGKSLLAQTISTFARDEHKWPTLVINEPWHGEAFNQFLQSLEQPFIVIFDEFEKVYSKEEQESVLTLLDGMYPSDKIYIFTANDKYRIDTHMRNRPGRIYYAIDYAGLDLAFVENYCNEKLNDKTQLLSIKRLYHLFKDFNFDMLKALVEEMNRYGESAQEAIKVLNIKPEYDNGGTFLVSLDLDVRDAKVTNMYTAKWNGSPFGAADIRVEFERSLSPEEIQEARKHLDPDETPDTSRWETIHFKTADIMAMNIDEGSFTYKHASRPGLRLHLTRERERVMSYPCDMI